MFTDIKQLHQIAEHYGCECNPHSKNELITSLLANLQHRHTIKLEVQKLTPIEAHFLLLLFLDKRLLFSLEDLLAKASIALAATAEKTKEEARRLIAGALKRGWIFPAKGTGAGQYQTPHDLREPYIYAWLESQTKDWQADMVEPLGYRDEGTALCDDMLQFLRFLEAEPIPLTADGGMYKRYQTQLFQFLNVKEAPLPPQKWRFGYGLHFDLYPDRFSLLYDFCYFRRYIEENGGFVRITDQGRELIADPAVAEHYHELIRFWLRLYKRAIPNLPMLVQLIPLLSAGRWIAQSQLSGLLLPWIKPFYYDEPIDILSNRVLKMMVHLGLLKVGQSAEQEWMYTTTSASQAWLGSYNGFVDTTILLK